MAKTAKKQQKSRENRDFDVVCKLWLHSTRWSIAKDA